jgi:DNA-binding beta-propeller fold protein YncE
MKTTLTSNWRPLLRAFYPFLIAAAALWAMPRTARAQLYVAEGTFVGKYDAKTGAAISPSFITGLNFPVGLAVKGNTLFVANNPGSTVGAYDAKTGAAINASFITGLFGPQGIAVKSAK